MSSRIRKRRSTRVDFEAPIVVRTHLGSVRGTCRNLSLGGLFFTGPMLPVGERVQVAVTLGARELHVEGQILYQHAYSDGTGLGVMFTQVPADERLLLEHWLEQLQRPPAEHRPTP